MEVIKFFHWDVLYIFKAISESTHTLSIFTIITTRSITFYSIFTTEY